MIVSSVQDTAAVLESAPPANAISFALLDELCRRPCGGPTATGIAGTSSPGAASASAPAPTWPFFKTSAGDDDPCVAGLPGGPAGHRGFPQAGRGGRDGPCAGRGTGIGHGLPPPRGGRGQPLQHAGGQSGHQPGRRRHATPARRSAWKRPWNALTGRPIDAERH